MERLVYCVRFEAFLCLLFPPTDIANLSLWLFSFLTFVRCLHFERFVWLGVFKRRKKFFFPSQSWAYFWLDFIYFDPQKSNPKPCISFVLTPWITSRACSKHDCVFLRFAWYNWDLHFPPFCITQSFWEHSRIIRVVTSQIISHNPLRDQISL